MDVASLYTNIDENERAEACYRKFETRENPSIPSSILKKLILLVLNNNYFRFGNIFVRQKKGTAMATPIAPNYANVSLDEFEQSMLQEYFKKHGKRPLIWLRFIHNIFLIWTDGNESL